MSHPSRATLTPADIAQATASVLARSVPVGVAGVVFLSGGLSDETASDYLKAVNILIDESCARVLSASVSLGNLDSDAENKVEPADYAYARLPPLTFSFGRGLQGGAMTKWVKQDEKGACEAFRERSKVCWTAVRGSA